MNYLDLIKGMFGIKPSPKEYTPTETYSSGADNVDIEATKPLAVLPIGFMWIWNRNNRTWQVAVRADYAKWQAERGNLFNVREGRFYTQSGEPVS